MADNKSEIINLPLGLTNTLNEVTDDDQPSDRARVANIDINQVADLANHFALALNGMSPNFKMMEIAKSLAPEAFIKKAGYWGNTAVTAGNSFGRISYMPSQSPDMGILQWPGIPPDALTKIARDNLAPQMIIRNRVDDVIRYLQISTHPWNPGWQIAPKDTYEEMTDVTRREIREAEKFLLQGGTEFDTAIERDEHYFVDFTHFLAQIVDSSLTYDGIAIWTLRDKQDRVVSFAPFPTQNVRLVARTNDYGKQIPSSVMTPSLGINYMGTPIEHAVDHPENIFAVGVDEAGNIQYKFTRRDLIWYIRNPRSDGAVQGYGWSELESALLLIKGFTDAVLFNTAIFDRNAIPKGLLLLKGAFTNKQFDAMNRAWSNLQRSPRNDWSLPVMQISEKGGVEILNLEPLRGNEGYYHHLMNLFFGAFATIYRFPVHRLGYKMSGTNSDPKRDWPRNYLGDEDLGLTPLLIHVEDLINSYLIWSRWPHLQFMFTDKNPREDARSYEARMGAMTADERRREVGLPRYVDLADTDTGKVLAEIMGLAPVDPTLTGIFSNIINAMARVGAKGLIGMGLDALAEKNLKTPASSQIPSEGAAFTSKKDPAKSEEHGHQSGVKRDSRKEKHKSPSTTFGPEPNGRINQSRDPSSSNASTRTKSF